MSIKSTTEESRCPIDIAMSYLGKKWSFHIITSLFLGRHHFHEIVDSYDELSSKVLSERLKELELHNLIEKKIVSKSPLKREYHLTKKGRSLNKVIYEVGIFASTHYRKKMNVSNKEFIKLKKYYEEKLGI